MVRAPVPVEYEVDLAPQTVQKPVLIKIKNYCKNNTLLTVIKIKLKSRVP